MQSYVSKYQLPVQEQTTVESITQQPEDGLFVIRVSYRRTSQQYYARQVIIASGEANELSLPALAETLPYSVRQLHAGEYQQADQLPAGAVLVVGSAQSGCQIAEDLALAGRSVYLSTSMVGRLPRHYRGRDIMDWLLQLHFFDARKEDIADPAMLRMKTPQLSGSGQTISLQSLAKKGVQIIGKLADTDGRRLFFRPNAAMHVQFADGFSTQVKEMIDGFIEQQELPVAPAQPDDNDRPDIDTVCISPVSELGLEQISTIIWATGFGGHFDYIELPVLDEHKRPVHVNGSSPVEGLYFLGLHWLRSRKSGLINGIVEDAEFICKEVYKRHQVTPSLS
jgi:putative flavoprotein involved in K+ transport